MRVSLLKFFGLITLVMCSGTVGRLDANAASASPTLGKPSNFRSANLLANDLESRNISCAVSRRSELVCWGAAGEDLGLSPAFSSLDPFPVTVIPGLPQVAAVAVRESGICIAAKNGRLICWGWDGAGLGFGPGSGSIPAPQVVPKIKGATDVSLSAWGTGCAVAKEGHVWCWGSNHAGVMGTGTTNRSALLRDYSPARVPGIKNASRVFALENGGACAVLRNQQLRCWGGGYPLVGLSRPTRLHNFSKIRLIADTFGDDTCLADNRGDVWCWGPNKYGRAGSPEGVAVSAPTRILGPKDVIDISVDLGTCALERSGGIWCWGKTGVGYELNSFASTKVAAVDSAIALVQQHSAVCVLTSTDEIACVGVYGWDFGDADGAQMSDPRLAPCRHFRSSRCTIEPYRVRLP